MMSYPLFCDACDKRQAHLANIYNSCPDHLLSTWVTWEEIESFAPVKVVLSQVCCVCGFHCVVNYGS